MNDDLLDKIAKKTKKERGLNKQRSVHSTNFNYSQRKRNKTTSTLQDQDTADDINKNSVSRLEGVLQREVNAPFVGTMNNTSINEDIGNNMPVLEKDLQTIARTMGRLRSSYIKLKMRKESEGLTTAGYFIYDKITEALGINSIPELEEICNMQRRVLEDLSGILLHKIEMGDKSISKLSEDMKKYGRNIESALAKRETYARKAAELAPKIESLKSKLADKKLDIKSRLAFENQYRELEIEMETYLGNKSLTENEINLAREARESLKLNQDLLRYSSGVCKQIAQKAIYLHKVLDELEAPTRIMGGIVRSGAALVNAIGHVIETTEDVQSTILNGVNTLRQIVSGNYNKSMGNPVRKGIDDGLERLYSDNTNALEARLKNE